MLNNEKNNLDYITTLLSESSDELKKKVEFLCNECCNFNCSSRRKCYENVSLKSLGEDCPDHVCTSPLSFRGYRFSDAMDNPGFIGTDDIQNVYCPMGFGEYKIEGRSLGSAVVFEMLLYYMVRPEFHLKIREEIYLDSGLDLFWYNSLTIVYIFAFYVKKHLQYRCYTLIRM